MATVSTREFLPLKRRAVEATMLGLVAILSLLLTKYEAAGNAKALALITQMSPAAWRHILLNGHYTFQTDGKFIDLDALVAGLELG